MVVVVRRVEAKRLVNLLDHALVQVGPDRDATPAHRVDQLVRLAGAALLVPVLHHECVNVADAHTALAVRVIRRRRHEHLVADRDGLLRVRSDEPSRSDKPVNQVETLAKVCGALGRIVRLRLCEVLFRLEHRLHGLFIVSELVNLDLRARLVKRREAVHRLGLGVKADDVLHHLRVGMPVERLQVVGRHHVHVLLARHACEEDDLLRVARPQQRLHRLDLLARLRVFLGCELPSALALGDLGNALQRQVALLRRHHVLAGRHRLRHLLGDHDLLLDAHLKRARVLVRRDQHLDRLVELPVLHEELRAARVQAGVGRVGLEVVGNVLEHVKQLGRKAHLHSLGQLAALHVERRRLVVLPPFVEVVGSIDHHQRRGLERKVHEVRVQLILLGQAHAVAEALGLRVVLDGLRDALLRLVLPREVERCRGVRVLLDLVAGGRKAVGVAQDAHDGQRVADRLVQLVGLLQRLGRAARLAVARPPQRELIVVLSLGLDVRLQLVHLLTLEVHARHLDARGARLFVVLQRGVKVTRLLQVLRVCIVCRLQVYPVVLLRNLQRFVPRARCAVQLVQQVEAVRRNVHFLRVLHHAQVHRDARHARVQLSDGPCLACCSRAARVLHLAKAVLRDVETLVLDAQVRHVAPHRR
mmetsp:Transcript_7852/g.23631  ORF Transcript_7852/g.23631 Transcript_7852/m.23631 type:complete len:643 (-) Transcript_7852:2054-3982(-)